MTKQEKKRLEEICESFRNLGENEKASKEVEEEYLFLREKYERDKERARETAILVVSVINLIISGATLLVRILLPILR